VSELAAAVVGTGFIGPVHIEALRRLNRPVVGILASTPDKGRKVTAALGIPRAYADYAELLADPLVKVIHLTSPNRLHFEQCKQALAAEKHVICEKPLAMTTAETRELVALARAASVVSAVCYNVRFYPLCLEARQRIAAGELGDIYHVTGSYVQDWLLYDTDFNWRVLADEGGKLRAVADIGTHWVDLVLFITGKTVERVCADLRTFLPNRRRPKGSVDTFQSKLPASPLPLGERGRGEGLESVKIDTEDYGSVLLRFQGGASGCFTVSQVTAGRKNCLRFEIAGSKGSLAWNSERPNELWIGHRDKANELLLRDPALLHSPANRYAATPGGHNEGFVDTFKQLFCAVYEYIEGGDRETRPFASFEDGHREVALCEAILQSHQTAAWAPV
jgi:predicted dehydrogenase